MSLHAVPGSAQAQKLSALGLQRHDKIGVFVP